MPQHGLLVGILIPRRFLRARHLVERPNLGPAPIFPLPRRAELGDDIGLGRGAGLLEIAVADILAAGVAVDADDVDAGAILVDIADVLAADFGNDGHRGVIGIDLMGGLGEVLDGLP